MTAYLRLVAVVVMATSLTTACAESPGAVSPAAPEPTIVASAEEAGAILRAHMQDDNSGGVVASCTTEVGPVYTCVECTYIRTGNKWRLCFPTAPGKNND